jgi:hypothetical protein
VTTYKDNITYIKDEDLLLPEEGTYSADDTEILNAQDCNVHVLPFAFINRRCDNSSDKDDSLVSPWTIMDVIH